MKVSGWMIPGVGFGSCGVGYGGLLWMTVGEDGAAHASGVEVSHRGCHRGHTTVNNGRLQPCSREYQRILQP